MLTSTILAIPSEIINTLIGAGSAIVSAVIAFLVSRYTLKKETEKMKLSWDREDSIASEDDFKSMAEAVAAYLAYNSQTNQHTALAKVAGIRATETRIFAEELDELYNHIRRDNTSAAEDLLSKIIEHKRKIQREGDAPLRKKKKK